MSKIAFVSSSSSLSNDFDMSILTVACERRGICADICYWNDEKIDWRSYDAVVIRSPWDYSDRLDEFLDWCDRVNEVTMLFNPAPVVRWSLDKRYLKDLAACGIPIVPSGFIEPGMAPGSAIEAFLTTHSDAAHFVIKPTIGCYSKNVQRFSCEQIQEALAHVNDIMKNEGAVVIQPYLESIDDHGETNAIYFDGKYSHAIRKGALLLEDGTVNVPSYDFRRTRDADPRERALAEAALAAAERHLNLQRPLLYARVDMIRGNDGNPLLLELEVAEPSLSLPLDEFAADRFAEAIVKLPTLMTENECNV